MIMQTLLVSQGALVASVLLSLSACGFCGATEYAKQESPDRQHAVRLLSTGCGQETAEVATLVESATGMQSPLIDTRNAATLESRWASASELHIILTGTQQERAERDVESAASVVGNVRISYFAEVDGRVVPLK